MSRKLPLWTGDEWIVALDFYLNHREKIPANTSSEIKALSQTLRNLRQEIIQTFPEEQQKVIRNPKGVYLQVIALAALDPEYVGNKKRNTAKLAQEIWQRYGSQHNLVSEMAQQILQTKTVALPLTGQEEEGMEYAIEGVWLSRRHWIRERNPQIVKRKKVWFVERYKDIFCEICDFNYRKNYGDRGDGYIECHHNKPLSEGIRQTRLEDLILICANCHRMIHRYQPWLDDQQVKTLIEKQPYP